MKGRRRHISWKTRCASAVLALMNGREPGWYGDAKQMTETQFLSLFHWDHNIFHETGHLDADKYWNLTPMLILAHREKTKQDAKVIAKGRRIRAWNTKTFSDSVGAAHEPRLGPAPPLRIGPDELRGKHFRRTSIPPLSGPHKPSEASMLDEPTPAEEFSQRWADYVRSTKPKRKIRSRGFDKSRRRKMSGKVVKRER